MTDNAKAHAMHDEGHSLDSVPVFDHRDQYFFLLDEDLKTHIGGVPYVRSNRDRDLWRPLHNVALADLRDLAALCVQARAAAPGNL